MNALVLYSHFRVPKHGVGMHNEIPWVVVERKDEYRASWMSCIRNQQQKSKEETKVVVDPSTLWIEKSFVDTKVFVFRF